MTARACLATIGSCALACFVTSGGVSFATSFETMPFRQLVARADMIFVGDVLDVRPAVVRGRDDTVIRTRVTFVVRDALWGTSSTLEILEFLGGRVGDVSLVVDDMPVFQPGERRLVFARRGESVNPIVGFTQGVMRLDADRTGADVVRSINGEPVSGTAEMGRPHVLSSSRGSAMRWSGLRSEIVTLLRERRE